MSSEQIHPPLRRVIDRRMTGRRATVRRVGHRPYVPVAGALRAVETFLLSSGQQTARRNAWAGVVADRQRARDRRDAEHEMAALSGREHAGVSEPR